ASRSWTSRSRPAVLAPLVSRCAATSPAIPPPITTTRMTSDRAAEDRLLPRRARPEMSIEDHAEVADEATAERRDFERLGRHHDQTVRAGRIRPGELGELGGEPGAKVDAKAPFDVAAIQMEVAHELGDHMAAQGVVGVELVSALDRETSGPDALLVLRQL